MASLCPLLLHASLIGRTYHDFQLKFESPLTNCTVDSQQNPLLIQFTRIFNSTRNDTSYVLYDPNKPHTELPHLQVFHDDHVKLCIRSALQSDNHDVTCHEFYMVTMLSSVNTAFWPLLIIFGYITILLFAMLFSLFAQLFNKLSKTLFSGSITKKLIRKHKIGTFIPLIQRHEQTNNLKKLDEKQAVLKSIDLIAKECRANTSTFIIQTPNKHGHINRTYL